MTRPFSLYLDLVRFAAALMVFFAHASWGMWTGGLFWPLRPLGSDAVAIFFVLSGFVIAYAAAEREHNGRTYTINRLARLHSGAVPAIAITLLADAIGRTIQPGLYEGFGYFRTDAIVWRLLNCLAFTHQLWFSHIQPGTNMPYWSLGYEAPYYLAFGLAAFAPARWGLPARIAIWVAVMLLAGPNIAKLAPMWLFGVAAWRLTRTHPLSPRIGLIAWALSMVWLATTVVPTHLHATLFTNMHADPAYLNDMLHYYSIAAAFALNLVGFQAAAPLFARLLEPAATPIRWAGARTFALYLLHMPLIQLAVAASPWPPTAWPTRALIFLGVPLAIAALAELSERRKHTWRRFYDRLFTALALRHPALTAAPVLAKETPKCPPAAP